MDRRLTRPSTSSDRDGEKLLEGIAEPNASSAHPSISPKRWPPNGPSPPAAGVIMAYGPVDRAWIWSVDQGCNFSCDVSQRDGVVVESRLRRCRGWSSVRAPLDVAVAEFGVEAEDLRMVGASRHQASSSQWAPSNTGLETNTDGSVSGRVVVSVPRSGGATSEPAPPPHRARVDEVGSRTWTTVHRTGHAQRVQVMSTGCRRPDRAVLDRRILGDERPVPVSAGQLVALGDIRRWATYTRTKLVDPGAARGSPPGGTPGRR